MLLWAFVGSSWMRKTQSRMSNAKKVSMHLLQRRQHPVIKDEYRTEIQEPVSPEAPESTTPSEGLVRPDVLLACVLGGQASQG